MIMKIIDTPYLLAEKEKHIQRVMKLENVFVANIQLKAGEEIPKHDSKKEVIIAVRKGAVMFDVEGTEVVVTEENVLHMDPLEMHSLRAVEDTDLLVIQVTP